jgi:hypothetical protein
VLTFVHLLLYKLAVIIYLPHGYTRMQIRPYFQPNALWRSVCVFPFLRHIGHTRSKHFGEGCAGGIQVAHMYGYRDDSAAAECEKEKVAKFHFHSCADALFHAAD